MSAAGKSERDVMRLSESCVYCLALNSPYHPHDLSRMRYLLCCADQRSANLPIPYIASGFQWL